MTRFDRGFKEFTGQTYDLPIAQDRTNQKLGENPDVQVSEETLARMSVCVLWETRSGGRKGPGQEGPDQWSVMRSPTARSEFPKARTRPQ